MGRFGLGTATTAVVAMLVGASAGHAQTAATDHEVKLKGRSFTPSARVDVAGITRAAGARRAHFFLQFDSVPDARGRGRVRAAGVELVSALGGPTYVASAPRGRLAALPALPGARWAAPIAAADKVDAAVLRGAPAYARTADDRLVLTTQVHPDVSMERARQIVRDAGGELGSSTALTRTVTAALPSDAVWALAATDEVQFVALKDAPLGDHNDGARPALNLGALPAAPYNLTGAGVTVMVYDSGIVDPNHGDFAGRTTQTDGDSAARARSHSTHVAGTALGSGAGSAGNDNAGNPNGGSANQWAGMAPGANLATYGSLGSNSSSDLLYDDQGDLTTDAAAAILGGIDLTTMSLGNNTGPNGFPCGQLGDYTNTSIALDALVTGASGQELIFFQSAGNERGDGCDTVPNYRTISSPAPAKDTIVVGATNSNDNSMTGFSSWGPVDDGRLRPDVVGPGCQSNGDGRITSTDFGDTGGGNLDPGEISGQYSGKCGTSMSTPAVAGMFALAIQAWRGVYGAGTRPKPHTAKALLAHTATDLGTAGPDYANGYGHVNGQAAIDLVRASGAANLIAVDTVDQGEKDLRYFSTDASAPPRVTLAWSDPAATRTSAAQLVNDLDLRLRAPDGTIVQPLVLDPANPAGAAVQGNDARNVMEMVVPGAAQAGAWAVEVQGTSVTTGPQEYTLITSADATADPPPTAEAGGPYTTPEGTPVGLSAAGSGDPQGGGLTYAWDLDADGAFDDSTSATPSFGAVGNDGVFDVAVQVTDSDGDTATDASTVTVTNVAPVVASALSGGPEGSLITLGGAATDAGWEDAVTATIDWGDGSTEPADAAIENVAPTATRTLSAGHRYADNGTYPVQVCAADDDTTTCEAINLVISNVAPAVAFEAGQVTQILEGDTLALAAGFSDPGWADTYASAVDWGFGAGESGLLQVLTQGPLQDAGRVTASRQYGDDGTFGVSVKVTDDDAGSGDAGFSLGVGNVDPTAVIDDTAAITFNGQPAFLAPVGQPMPFSGDSEDPGSDDLTVSWDWDTSAGGVDESRSYLAGLLPDPDPSPEVNPRDLTDSTSHVFGSACLYEIAMASQDDDGGSAADTAAVIITGNALLNRSTGYWGTQAAGKKADIPAATFLCYLKIAGFASGVFHEKRDASTAAKARSILEYGGNSALQKLDRQLLGVWLNFANGATDWNQPVDTVGDAAPDTTLAQALAAAEGVRLTQATDAAAVTRQKDMMERINLRDQ